MCCTAIRTCARTVALIMGVPLMTVMVWAGWHDVYIPAPLDLRLWPRVQHPWLNTGYLAMALGARSLVVHFLVFLFLWSPRMRRAILVAALASLNAICLPFIAWAGPTAFANDTVGPFMVLPTIPHPVALQSLLAYLGCPGPSLAVTADILGVVTLALTSWQPADVSDLLWAAEAVGLIAFLVSYWAFFDYRAVVAYALFAALAATGFAGQVTLPCGRPYNRHRMVHQLS